MTTMYKKLNSTEVDNKIKEIVPNKMTVRELVRSINNHSNIVRELIESMIYKERKSQRCLKNGSNLKYMEVRRLKVLTR